MIFPLKKNLVVLLATLCFIGLNANSTEIIDFNQGVPYGFTLEGGMSTFDGYISDSQYDKSSTLVFPNPVFVSSLDLNALPWEDYGFDIVTSSYPVVGLDIAGNTVFEIEVDLSDYANWDNWLTLSTFDRVAVKSIVFGPAVTEMFPSIDNIVVDLADGADPCVLSMEPYNECVYEEFVEYNCEVYGICGDDIEGSLIEAFAEQTFTCEYGCDDEDFVAYNCEVYGVCLDDESSDSEVEAPTNETVSNDEDFVEYNCEVYGICGDDSEASLIEVLAEQTFTCDYGCDDEDFVAYNCVVYGVCLDDEPSDSEVEAPTNETVSSDNVLSTNSALQQLSVVGSPVGRSGDSVDVALNYNVSDNNPNLTGLGFKAHYDSSVLTFNEFGFLFDDPLFATVENDINDLDNDPSTDKYVTAGWVSLFSTFPGVLPQNLTTLNFSIASDTNLQSTSINFSSDNTSAGYAFSADNYVLDIISTTWDIDGNGKADALTDGLTLLKASFGLSGQSMIEGSIATDSNMTLEDIEGSMEKAMTIADIDDSGDVDALTDGLMVLRYLFGVEDSGLTEGAISTNAKREAHQSIVDHLEKHMPADM